MPQTENEYRRFETVLLAQFSVMLLPIFSLIFAKLTINTSHSYLLSSFRRVSLVLSPLDSQSVMTQWVMRIV